MSFDRKTYMREYMQRYWAARPGENAKRVTVWQKSNPDKAAAKSARWYQRHKDEIRPKSAARHRHYRATLAPWYGAHLLAKHSPILRQRDIPIKLSEAKNAEVKVRRLCREINQRTSKN